MNYFTKAELLIIHLAIIRDINQFEHILKGSPSMLKLRDKLESMIDNHCEHEHTRTISDVDYVEICRDCERILR